MRKMIERPESPTTSPGRGWSREELRGRAVAIAVLSFFGLSWASWGTSTGVSRSVETWITAAAVLCFLALLVGAVLIFWRVASAPASQQSSQGRAIGRRFGFIVGVEFVGLIIAARVLAGTGHAELIPTVVCLGVGIHFFPLSRMFKIPMYDLTGAALCLAALATAVLAPVTGRSALWTMLPGFGAALALYITSALLIRAATTSPARS